MKKVISRSSHVLCRAIIFVVLVISFISSVLIVCPDWFVGKDFVKMVNQSARHMHTNRNLFRTGRHPIPEKGPPLVLENQTRYPGEDAMFTCNTSIINVTISDVGPILWIKNNKEVLNGPYRYITKEVKINSEVQVITNLTIYSVTEEDFGMFLCYVIIGKFQSHKKQKSNTEQQTDNVNYYFYRCPCDQLSPKYPEFNIDEQFYKEHKDYWIGEYHLLREKPRTRTLFIVPGTLVSLSVYFRHLRKMNFSVLFTRSDQEIQSFDIQCSYSARFMANLIHLVYPVSYNNVTYWNTTTGYHWKADVGIIWSCISPSMYGVYEITILRNVYLCGIELTEKIYYPTKVYIKPKESTIVNENISNNKNREVAIINDDCWSDEESEPKTCKYVRTLVLKIYDDNIIYETLISRNIIILFCVSILIIVILQFFIVPFVRCKLLQFYCVMQRTGNTSLAGIEINPDIRYHLYISSSSVSADRSFIAGNILPTLGRLNLKVFDGQDDVLPGSMELTEMSNAISKSLKCLVIASNKYIETSLQNHFEINCILSKFSKCDLLIVNVDNCLIHEKFEGIYKVINCSRDGLSEQDKTELMQWSIQNSEITFKNLRSQIISLLRCISYIVYIVNRFIDFLRIVLLLIILLTLIYYRLFCYCLF